MAFTPRTFRKGDRTEVANSLTEETDLRWDGWVPDDGTPYTPPPAFSAAELLELRAAFGSVDNRAAGAFLRGLTACADRLVTPCYGFGTNAAGQVSYRIKRVAQFDISGGLRLAYSNWARGSVGATGSSEVDNTNPITVKASLDVGGVFYPIFFDGGRDVIIQPGGDVLSDPLDVDLAKGAVFYEVVWVRVTEPALKWPLGLTGSFSNAEGNNTASGGGDLTATAAVNGTNFTYANSVMYSATAIVATPAPAVGALARVLAIGDSVDQGYAQSERSWIARALESRLPLLNLAINGDQAQNLVQLRFRYRRGKYSTGAVVATEGYGINDLSSGRTVAQVQADKIALWNMLRGRGVKAVYTRTITPRTTSTDNWATTANQTVWNATYEPRRVELNNWLRAGAPINSTTGAAVAAGTSGALLAGADGHPLTGFYEIADAVESARDSGIWKADGAAQKYTTDGIHPSGFGQDAMAATVDWTVLAAVA